MSEAPTTNPIRDWIDEQFEERTRRDWLIDVGPFALLVIMGVFFSAQSDVFLTWDNLVGNVFRNSTILLILALAGTFPILQQSIDLSVAQNLTMTAIVTAFLVPELGMLALPVAILLGGLGGLFNGVVFTKFGIPSFLVTLGSLSIMEGVANTVTGGSTISFRNQAVQSLAGGQFIPNVPNLVVWGLAAYVVTIVITWRTKFGRFTYALGENERVVDLSGVDVDRYKIYAFVASGLLCGLAGTLLASRIGAATPVIGSGFLLPSIAAIVMGGTALTGGVGGPHRTLLGVAVIAILRNGMNLMQIGQFTQQIILGFVVILAVAMSMDRRKIDIIK
jgi:ribose transport system permease protein/putative xylitol transport system permease protein